MNTYCDKNHVTKCHHLFPVGNGVTKCYYCGLEFQVTSASSQNAMSEENPYTTTIQGFRMPRLKSNIHGF